MAARTARLEEARDYQTLIRSALNQIPAPSETAAGLTQVERDFERIRHQLERWSEVYSHAFESQPSILRPRL